MRSKPLTRRQAAGIAAKWSRRTGDTWTVHKCKNGRWKVTGPTSKKETTNG